MLILSRTTPDGLFTITIESTGFDDGPDLPVEGIEALIHELEVLRAMLIGFVIESGRETTRAN